MTHSPDTQSDDGLDAWASKEAADALSDKFVALEADGMTDDEMLAYVDVMERVCRLLGVSHD